MYDFIFTLTLLIINKSITRHLIFENKCKNRFEKILIAQLIYYLNEHKIEL